MKGRELLLLLCADREIIPGIAQDWDRRGRLNTLFSGVLLGEGGTEREKGKKTFKVDQRGPHSREGS